MLDIFEALLHNDTKVADKRRPRIEHAQIMRMEDLERAGRLGGELSVSHGLCGLMSRLAYAVITSVQPTHA